MKQDWSKSTILQFFFLKKQKDQNHWNWTMGSLVAYYTMWSSLLFTQSCLTLCDPTDCTTPGFPILHHLPKFVQTHVHWVSDAIQPSRPLSSPSPPAFPALGSFLMSQLFPTGGQNTGASASVLPMNIQDWFPLGWTGLILHFKDS